jgi:peptidoglycan/xylan/chitin deacetylase (PgdA/CDA1 family)
VFEASSPFALFDYFRVPYAVRPAQDAGAPGPAAVHWLRAVEQPGRARRSLLWLAPGAHRAGRAATAPLGRYQLAGCTFFGHVASDIPQQARDIGYGWRPAEPISDAEGHAVAAVWRDRDGSIFLPFDPGEVMLAFWSESYRNVGRSSLAAAGPSALRRCYYLARPALPRTVQVRIRQAFTRVQGRSSFPGWPEEDSLHGLYRWLLASVAEVAGGPVPFLEAWPDGRSWALVLTHDVETEAGYRTMGLLRDPERALGYRSSWNFVAERYRVEDAAVRALQDEGCEVGVHGLRHDGRDLASRRLMEKRLPAMRDNADRWQAVGFRSPSTQRDWRLMPRLGFDYDSSYSDTDPYEPQSGGCCSYLPFFNQGMVELPITLPQDHTLFCILQDAGAGVWIRKARFLRERGGMALVLTHPDYARDPQVADGYRELLETFHGDQTAWPALPREVARWWRERDASALRRDGDGWRIVGPASARGRVGLAGVGGLREDSLR